MFYTITKNMKATNLRMKSGKKKKQTKSQYRVSSAIFLFKETTNVRNVLKFL
ncbi:hypothetical protein PGB90_006654 [Kerria lacca]